MKNNEKEMNLTLIELFIGIVVFGVISQTVTLFVTHRILYYSLGLWVGIVGAIGMATHMYHTISNALDAGEAGAQKIVRTGAIVRYVVACIIMAGLAVVNIASPITAFVGLIGLKFGAYLQPLTHNILRKAGPRNVRAYIANDDARREVMLKEYEEEQARIAAQKEAVEESGE